MSTAIIIISPYQLIELEQVDHDNASPRFAVS